jgi:CRP-like cAMP-binding protein
MAMRDSPVVQPGERTNPAGKAVRNRILLLIPDREYRSIRPHLEFLALSQHLTLHEPSQRLEFVYFPNGGLLSLVVATESGSTVEVGVVGNEGVVGIPSTVGLSTSPLREVVQISGDGFRVRVSALQNILRSSPQLQMTLNRYAVLQGLQVAQTAACNRLHKTEQRLARWLLMVQDRMDSGLLRLTHDFLATMLGTDRPSVSLAAGILRRKQIIECTRGTVKILNRKKLESRACECYRVIQQLNSAIGLN